jgi:hypothetical protein
MHSLDGKGSRMTTEPRNEFGFEEWYCENAFDYCKEPIGTRDCGLQRQAWHAAIDAIRAKLATKELWIAPKEADEEMLKAMCVEYAARNQWDAARDSHLLLQSRWFNAKIHALAQKVA